eukprot:395400_1
MASSPDIGSMRDTEQEALFMARTTNAQSMEETTQVCIDPLSTTTIRTSLPTCTVRRYATITTSSLPSVICSFPTHSQSMLDLNALREQGAPNCRNRTFIPSKMDAKEEKKEANRANNNGSTYEDEPLRG